MAPSLNQELWQPVGGKDAGPLDTKTNCCFQPEEQILEKEKLFGETNAKTDTLFCHRRTRR